MYNYKTIITFTLPQDAYLARGLLESEGIETTIKDELTVQVNNFYSNAIGGVKLQVKESDFENGLFVLKRDGYITSETTDEVKIEIVSLNNTTNKKICPFCQSDNIGKKEEVDKLTGIIYFIFGVIFPIFRRAYKCFDCGKVWKFTKQ